MYNVQILMSTYNGEKYLEQQLDSLLCQTYPNLQILIRDDGSSDDTIKILERYSKENDNISYYKGKNVGVVQSFFDLLQHSDDSVAYYGFSDQDDKWLPEKVEKAIEKLKVRDSQIPMLYCSDTFITDENLNIIKKEVKKPRPSWGNALVQNICTGCTAMMNHRLRDIIKETKPERIVMHDWWFYITAALFGEIYYDSNSYILYRQHMENVCGVKKSAIDIWKYRLIQLTKKRGYIYKQLDEVKKWYLICDKEKEVMLDLVLSTKKCIWNRIKLVWNKQVYRNNRMDDLVYRIIVLIGKL